MRTAWAVAATFVLVSGAASARAQEAPSSDPAPAVTADEQENEPEAPRTHLQVLQHPYDLASFYRSSQSYAFDPGYAPEASRDKYPIAGFYRSHGSRGPYSTFWTNGYGYGYGYGARGMGGRGFMGVPRPRALGLNGDLCLFAPTFLAPVGPLTGVFFER